LPCEILPIVLALARILLRGQITLTCFGDALSGTSLCKNPATS
jgi:hypothetical protein